MSGEKCEYIYNDVKYFKWLVDKLKSELNAQANLNSALLKERDALKLRLAQIALFAQDAKESKL
jgi:hypothetical protein